MNLPVPPQTPPNDTAAPIGHMAADLNRPWEKLLSLATRVHYRRGVTIPHQDVPGFYYLSHGTVSLFYMTSSGRERLTLCLQPGCLFNEARSITGYDPECSFICTTDVEVWRFPADLLRDSVFISSHPEQIANLMHTMSMKMLIHYTFLAEMGMGRPDAHVCRFIINLSAKNGNSSSFPCKMNQQEVADLLGIHRATLARALQRLRQDRVIASFTAKRVEVLDWNAIRRIAGQ